MQVILLMLSFVAEDLPDRFEDLPGFATMPAAEKTTYTADAPWTKRSAACKDGDETGACLSAGVSSKAKSSKASNAEILIAKSKTTRARTATRRARVCRLHCWLAAASSLIANFM